MGAPGEKAYESTFKYRGELDFRKLVKDINEWASAHGFDVHYEEYVEKVPEIESMIVGERKLDEWWADYFEITWHMWDVKDVKKNSRGQRAIIHARGIFTVKGTFVAGYQNVYNESTLQQSEFLKKLATFFNKHILKKEIEFNYIDPLMYEIISLQHTMQESIGMEMGYTRYDVRH